jgi:hypothetical protein
MLRRGLQDTGNVTEAVEEDATSIEMNLDEELAAYAPPGSTCELWTKVYVLNEEDGSLTEVLNARKR